VAAIPGRVLGKEWLDKWLIEMRAPAAGLLDWEVGEEWCSSHWNIFRVFDEEVVV
jgi:hypothetical protein